MWRVGRQILVFALLALALGCPKMPGTAFSAANWTGYDEQSWTNPGSALTDFTGVIDISTLSADWKAAVQSDGGDIRVTKGDDTELPLDVIDWVYNAGAPTGLIRFKWTGTLAASGTQNVRVYAGYTGGTAVAYDATETYGSDNTYRAAFDLYAPDGGGVDRTANGYDGTANGGVTFGGISGKIGAGTNYDGSDDFSLIGDVLDLGTGALTVMYWGKSNQTGSTFRTVQKRGGGALGSQDGWQVSRISGTTADDWRNIVMDDGAAGVQSSNDGTLDNGMDNTWHHFAFVFNQPAGTITAYLDGSNAGITNSGSISGSVDTARELTYGCAWNDVSTQSQHYAGGLNEIQIHTEALGVDEIAHEVAMADQSTFWGTWAWTAIASGVVNLLTGKLARPALVN